MGECIRANIPITIVEGGTFDKTYKWKEGVSPQTAVDLTGYTAKLHVRSKYADTATLIAITQAAMSPPWSADAASGIYFFQDGDGEWNYRVYIKDEDTDGICGTPHKDIAGVYDLFLTSSAGETLLQHYGVATLVAAVTR